MKNKRIAKRRKILFGLTASAVGMNQLPKVWTKPLVNSVVLPVHAMTTTVTDSADTTTAAPTTTAEPLPTEFSGDITRRPLASLDKMLSLFISPAYAGIVAVTGGKLYIDTTNNPNFSATLLTSINGVTEELYTGSGIIGGGPVMLNGRCPAPVSNTKTLDVTNVGMTASYTIVWVGNGTFSGSLNPGTDIPSTNDPCFYVN